MPGYGQMVSFDDAIAWIEGLEVKDLATKEHILNRMRYERDKAVAIPPRYIRGRYGHKYSSYQCGNCGFGVNEATWKYCPNCGRKITDFVAGKRIGATEIQEGLLQAT